MGGGKCLPIRSAISPAIAISSFLVNFFLLSLVAVSSSALRLTSMNAPAVADLREIMDLDCHFDMGDEELYAVKWYKDDQEFFRYMPRQQPNTMVFPVAGVHLVPQGADCSHDHCKVKLWKLTRDHSGGAYRCEISSEAPAFRLASETHNVTVAALPRENPRIEGLTSSYVEGDTVTAKCVSDLSDPAPILSWYINGHSQALLQTVGEQASSEPNDLGLVSRSIALRFLAERKHSRGDSIWLRCESALPGVPMPPQVTTLTIPLRSAAADPQVINNQKLHWYSISSSAASALPSGTPSSPLSWCWCLLHNTRTVLLLGGVVVRWWMG